MNYILLSPIRLSEMEVLIDKCLHRYFANQQPKELAQPEQWFNLKQLCEYLPDQPAEQTVYGWVSAGTIPVHKGSKKLRFLKSEIDDWLKAGRKLTVLDAAAAADNFLGRQKKGVAA